VAPASVRAVHGALAVAVAGVEVCRGRGRAGRGGRQARALALGALGIGALLLLLGRTGGPLCAPTSRLQPHAGWHVLSAAAAAAALVTLPRR
jgi:hypothetical protein